MLLNLAFVPPSDIITHLKVIQDFAYEKELYNELKPIVQYFINTYIRKIQEDNIITEVENINIIFWSCYERVIKRIPYTNNNVEGWHRNFKTRTKITHPKIGRFICSIQKSEERLE
jgi:hypothetical protein